jgi:hypothetical protein
MAIVDTLNQWAFVDGFDKIDRGDNFTRPARAALFEWYDDFSDSMGEPIEYDPIAICCDWDEYSEEEILEEYGEPWHIVAHQYRHRVDLDERGEYRATIYEFNETGEEVAICTITGDMFAEGGELEGIDPADTDEVINHLIDVEGVDIGENDPEEGGDTIEEVIDSLENRTTVLTVEHYGAENTYLVMVH